MTDELILNYWKTLNGEQKERAILQMINHLEMSEELSFFYKSWNPIKKIEEYNPSIFWSSCGIKLGDEE